MSTNGVILAIIEPNVHPHEVVERAAWLARVTGCSLELCLCDQDIGPLDAGWFGSPEYSELKGHIAAAQQEMVQDFADNVRDTEISVTTEVLSERPIAEALIAKVLDDEPRFLVKGTQYHSAAERAIFVHTDWRLIRGCPCPLYFVKPKMLNDNPVIVAAVDPTHSHDKTAAMDDVIVRAAQDLAGRTGGDVHLLHTYHRLVGVGNKATRTFKPVKLPIDKLDEKMRQEHREKLDALASKHDVDAEHVHQLPGATHEIFPLFVRTHAAGVVVMGALARWGLKRSIIGSTAERLLDHLPCDVLIVKPE